MTGCCAFGCSNRSEKGFHMYRFPRNPERRKLWGNRVRRVGWKPTSSSLLCQEHFDHHQFENGRADGKKKLKITAVPTIFSHSKSPRVRKSPKKRTSTCTTMTTGIKACKVALLQDHNYFASPQSDSSSAAADTASEQEDLQDFRKRAQSRIRMKGRVKQLKADLRQTQKTCTKLMKAKAKHEARVSRLFGNDQLRALARGGMRGVEWSTTTVKKALQLRFSCGASGYKLLLQQHYPLPSDRTLQRRMEKVSFQPGVLGQVFDFLKLKVEGMRPEERICCLTLDEMSLTSSIEYDASGGNLMGSVTLPEHAGIATHALVFMLGGITTRWKQTVAYHYTSNSTDGAVFKDIILDIIQRAADISLHVEAVASDMGSANRAMWKSFGIICGKHCRTTCKIQHPQDPAKWLHFLADVPHLFKNIKSALVNGQAFTLSTETVAKHGLKSNVASVEPLKDLANFQEDLDLKLAPKLNMNALTPTHFDKMKVSNATRVLSHDVSCGLTYLVNKEGRDETYLTTAWLIEILDHWFNLMSSRHPVMGLSKLNPDKYDEAVTFLQDVIEIFKGLKVGRRGDWKPIQTGVILATTAVLSIADELLSAGHAFLLTSRLTQDCLENLFSSVRLRKPVPTPLEFKYALKLISNAQFLTLPRSGSYQQDDGEFLADFLEQPVRVPAEPPAIVIHLSEEPSSSTQELPQAERDSLYNLAGYCLHSIKQNEKTCDRCMHAVTRGQDEAAHHSAGLSQLKEYRAGCLMHISAKAYDMLLNVELMFRRAQSTLMKDTNVKRRLVAEAEFRNRHIDLPSCHGIKSKLLNKFINARLHFYCKKKNVELKAEMTRTKKGGELGSKSMAMRKLAQNVK